MLVKERRRPVLPSEAAGIIEEAEGINGRLVRDAAAKKAKEPAEPAYQKSPVAGYKLSGSQ